MSHGLWAQTAAPAAVIALEQCTYGASRDSDPEYFFTVRWETPGEYGATVVSPPIAKVRLDTMAGAIIEFARTSTDFDFLVESLFSALSPSTTSRLTEKLAEWVPKRDELVAEIVASFQEDESLMAEFAERCFGAWLKQQESE